MYKFLNDLRKGILWLIFTPLLVFITDKLVVLYN